MLVAQAQAQAGDAGMQCTANKNAAADVVQRMRAVRAKEADVHAAAAEYWREERDRAIGTLAAEAEGDGEGDADASGSTHGVTDAVGDRKGAAYCPAPLDSFASENLPYARGVALRVINERAETVLWFWVDSDGKELAMGELEASGGTTSSNTYGGHAWRARRKAGGTIVFEARTPNDAGEATLRVPACRTADQAADEATRAKIAAELAPPNAAFGRAEVEAACPALADTDGGWLNDHVAPGYHVLCVRKGSSGQPLDLAAYRGGRLGVEPRATAVARAGGTGPTMTHLRRVIEALVRMDASHALHTDAARASSREEYKPRRWRLFSTRGSAIDDLSQLPGVGVVLVFVGGQFIHPGVRVGFERKFDAAGHPVSLRTLSLRPLVFDVRGFLTVEECDHIIEQAGPRMAKAKVSHMDKDVGKPDTDFRTSTNTFLSSQDDAVLQEIDARVANLTRIGVAQFEQVQVLRYTKGQLYGAHHDYWPTDAYQQPDIVRMTEAGWKNRLLTVFWYMSDVQIGGETNFPDAVGFPAIDSTDVSAECRRGLRVKPERGKVIAFYSLLPDGRGDVTSLHGACPPTHGLKWAANKWIWNADVARRFGS
eukprot:g5385.t1